MSDTPEQRPVEPPAGPAQPTAHPTAPAAAQPTAVAAAPSGSNRLYRVAAWIAIVAGTIFIVAVVFVSGFILGRVSGDGHFGGHHHQHRSAEFHERMGPGRMGPDEMGPGRMGPDRGAPGQIDRPGPPMMPGAPPAPRTGPAQPSPTGAPTTTPPDQP